MNVAFEEQNAVLQRHTQSMSSARERLEQELALEERRTLALQQQLQAVRQALTASFASLPVPGAEAPPRPRPPGPAHSAGRTTQPCTQYLASSALPCPAPSTSWPRPRFEPGPLHRKPWATTPPAMRLLLRMTPPHREQSTRPPSLTHARAGPVRDALLPGLPRSGLS